MSLKLILMRHAKSDWGSPDLPDHARPLNDRGTSDAPLMGAWLARAGLVPDLVLCSTARRTRDTLQGLEITAPTQFLPSLYHAEPGTMLDELQNAEAQTVLMIGHNPGIALFAARLLQSAPVHPRFDDYPTCATLVASFPILRWSDLTYRSGVAVDFRIPADLKRPVADIC